MSNTAADRLDMDMFRRGGPSPDTRNQLVRRSMRSVIARRRSGISTIWKAIPAPRMCMLTAGG